MENYKIREMINEIDDFIGEIAKRYRINLVVSILNDSYRVPVERYKKILDEKGNRQINTMDKISMYDIEAATLAAYQNKKTTKIRDIRSRQRPGLWYRQVFCYIARKQGFSLHSIGLFISKNHATVLHTCRLIDDLLGYKDPDITRVYTQVMSNLELYMTPITLTDEQITQLSNQIQDLNRRLNVSVSPEAEYRTESKDISI